MPTPVVRGNSIYTIVDGPSWTEAEANSVRLGGHLVSIANRNEDNFLFNSFEGAYGSLNALWIGLTDRDAEGEWKWSDGSNLSYENWYVAQPGNSPTSETGEDYAVLVLRDNPSGDEGPVYAGQWGDQNNLGDGAFPGRPSGVAEIPLYLSISRQGEVKEGAGEFTTSINLLAGNQSTGNLAEGAHVYWKITGIQQSDLAAGYSLSGDGFITNGKLDIKQALVQDNLQENETFNISVYSDADFTQQIGTIASSVIIGDIGSTSSTASKTTTLVSTVSRLTLTGTRNINGTGNALNNYLTGNAGNNILDGGAGFDILAGGRGNDTYIVDSTYDSIIENANEGTDTVKSFVNWTLGANLENLTLTGADNLSGTGNELDNVITGNSGNNSLYGGGGNDKLYGMAGDDSLWVNIQADSNSSNYLLDGGAVNDSLWINIQGANNGVTSSLAGGSGVDSLWVNIQENSNYATCLLDGGTDSDSLWVNIQGNNSGGTFTLNGGTGNDSLWVNIQGNNNGGNFLLNGSSGDDSLNVTFQGDNNSGKTTLNGGAGNDTYYVDSAASTITDASGTDTVISSASWTLGSNLENLTLTGTDALTGIGNTLKNTIIGNAGNNVLDGMGATDILTGGAGADTFRFSTKPKFGASTADHLTDFNAAEGDRIQISKSAFGLASNATASLTTVSSASALTTSLGSTNTFVYDSSSGNLYWNQNGNKSGFGTGGIFAVLDNNSALTASNFSLI